MKMLCVNQKLLKSTFAFYSFLTIKPAEEILVFNHCNVVSFVF